MEEKQFYKREELDISVWEVMGVWWRNVAWIILCGVVFAAVTFFCTRFFVAPEYQSTTKMYVLTKESGAALTQADMQTSTFLTKDYIELIKSRTVGNAVIAELGLPMKVTTLLNKVSVATPAETRIVEIAVRDTDPQRAANIANAMRDLASMHIQQVMEVEAINVAEEANIPDRPVGPDAGRRATIGGLAGMALLMTILVILYFKNDTIKSSEDVEKHLGADVLGVIPLKEKEKKGLKAKKNRKG